LRGLESFSPIRIIRGRRCIEIEAIHNTESFGLIPNRFGQRPDTCSRVLTSYSRLNRPLFTVRETQRTAGAKMTTTTTIVVADDHKIVREGLVKLLEGRPDFTVIGEASDGEEAVQMVLEKQPDVVIMDIWMPRLSGIDATRRIGKRGSQAKILVLSMHESRTYVEEVLRAGASGYIVKNSASTDLLQAIDAVRSGASYLSPAITQQVVDAIARPGDSSPSGVAMLTDREREVLQLIAEGLSSKEIASMLGVSLKTVDSHRSNLMEKLDIHKVSGLVRFAIRAGLVEP
jgi:DNA-binding NarL/FixJ family response regulator